MATVRFALVGFSEGHARLSCPPHHRDMLRKERFLVSCALSLLWPERSRAKTTWPGPVNKVVCILLLSGFRSVLGSIG